MFVSDVEILLAVVPAALLLLVWVLLDATQLARCAVHKGGNVVYPPIAFVLEIKNDPCLLSRSSFCTFSCFASHVYTSLAFSERRMHVCITRAT